MFLFSACGIPRGEHEQLKQTCKQEKESLQAQIQTYQDEINKLKKLLSEKEQQYSSLFFRYETLSTQYLKLKKMLTKPDSNI